MNPSYEGFYLAMQLFDIDVFNNKNRLTYILEDDKYEKDQTNILNHLLKNVSDTVSVAGSLLFYENKYREKRKPHAIVEKYRKCFEKLGIVEYSVDDIRKDPRSSEFLSDHRCYQRIVSGAVLQHFLEPEQLQVNSAPIQNFLALVPPVIYDIYSKRKTNMCGILCNLDKHWTAFDFDCKAAILFELCSKLKINMLSELRDRYTAEPCYTLYSLYNLITDNDNYNFDISPDKIEDVDKLVSSLCNPNSKLFAAEMDDVVETIKATMFVNDMINKNEIV
jgi:hypothetical protein